MAKTQQFSKLLNYCTSIFPVTEEFICHKNIALVLLIFKGLLCVYGIYIHNIVVTIIVLMPHFQVTEDNVYTCVGHPLPTDITNIINWMLNEQFDVAYKSILFWRSDIFFHNFGVVTFRDEGFWCSTVVVGEHIVTLWLNEYKWNLIIILNSSTEVTDLKIAKGLALQEILTEVHKYIHRSKSLKVE